MAPISTPRSRPEPSTPSERRHAPRRTRGDRRARAALSVETLNSPATATSTTAASTGWGRSRSRPERNSTTTSTMPAAKSARQRRARAAALVDQRLRHAAADGKAAAEPGGEVRGREREELLVRVEPAAVLGGEHAADGGRLHGAEQEAGQRQRQQLVQVGPAARGQPDRRQPLRHLAEQLHAARVEPEQRRRQRCRRSRRRAPPGLFFRNILPSTSTASAAPPDGERRGIGLVEVLRGSGRCSPRSRPWAPWKPNSLGSCVLARNSATPHLKPTITLSEMKFTIAPAWTSQATNAISADQQRRARRERAEARRVAAGDLAERRADQQRDGGRDRDRPCAASCRRARTPARRTGRRTVRPRGGRSASEASPSPAGSRYAASVMPAATSRRSQPRWYARNQVTAGTETLMTSCGSSEVAAV